MSESAPDTTQIIPTMPHNEQYHTAHPMTKVDKKAALKLKIDNGLSYAQIAAMQGTSKQAVHSSIHKELKAIIAKNKVIKSYKDNRADILAGVQVRALASLDDDKLKSASALQIITATGILYDKERLERGLSNSNVSVQVGMTSTVADAVRELADRIGIQADDKATE